MPHFRLCVLGSIVLQARKGSTDPFHIRSSWDPHSTEHLCLEPILVLFQETILVLYRVEWDLGWADRSSHCARRKPLMAFASTWTGLLVKFRGTGLDANAIRRPAPGIHQSEKSIALPWSSGASTFVHSSEVPVLAAASTVPRQLSISFSLMAIAN